MEEGGWRQWPLLWEFHPHWQWEHQIRVTFEGNCGRQPHAAVKYEILAPWLAPQRSLECGRVRIHNSRRCSGYQYLTAACSWRPSFLRRLHVFGVPTVSEVETVITKVIGVTLLLHPYLGLAPSDNGFEIYLDGIQSTFDLKSRWLRWEKLGYQNMSSDILRLGLQDIGVSASFVSLGQLSCIEFTDRTLSVGRWDGEVEDWPKIRKSYPCATSLWLPLK